MADMPFDKRPSRSARRAVVGPGPKDDVRYRGKGYLVVSSETFIEGVHFDLAYTTPRELGHKAAAILMSDLASAGANPTFLQCGLGQRQGTSETFLLELRGGMEALASRYKIGVSMGNTVDSPTAFVLSVNTFGAVPDKLPSLDRAKPGDLIAITGDIGASAAGLNCIRRMGRDAVRSQTEVLQKHLSPEPRVREALKLLPLVSAMVDLTDGIASDLNLLAEGSRVGAIVDEKRLPISEATRWAERLINSNAQAWALYGAEDFELLVTLPPKHLKRAETAMKALGCDFTVVGEIVPARRGVLITTLAGETVPLAPKLWHPFVRRGRLR